jgi:phage anti-repressor protein
MTTTQLKIENAKLRNDLHETIELLNQYQEYFMSEKFAGANDFAHVKTDVMPKIMELKIKLISNL